MNKKKIVIIGGGLAGLSAGIRLLEKKPGLEVVLFNLGHHLGGKACSYEDEKGYPIVHGFHAIFNNYRRLIQLIKNAGVDTSSTLISNKGKSYFYEDDSGKIHQVGSLIDFNVDKVGYKNGYSFKENMKFINFYSKNMHTLMKEERIEEFDNICYRAWAIENGLDEALTNKRSFRFTRDALFNWPYEISAYIAFKSMRLLDGSSTFYFVDGSYGSQIIQPIANYFEKLGGKIELYKKLVAFSHSENKVTRLTFGRPDSKPHETPKRTWPAVVPVDSSTLIDETDFSHVIFAIPLDNFRELNPGDKIFWGGFPGIENLRTVATLSWQMWTKEQVLPKLPSGINGLDEPMGMVVDYKHILSKYKSDKEIGSALEWVGQESDFEQFNDEQLKNIILSSFLKIPGAKDPRTKGILHESFNRNTSNHERYLLTEPGTLQFRPFGNTHLHNLFLAGDWVRNEVDVPTMEGAVASGQETAEKLLSNW